MTEKLLKSFKHRLRRLTLRLLKGKRYYFSCRLPERTGFLTSWLLRLFYSGITLEEKQIRIVKALPEDAIIVYTTKFKSYFEFFFCHSRFPQKGLPGPEIGLNLRFIMLQPVSRLLRIILSQGYYLLRHFKLPHPYASGYIREALLSNRAAFFALGEKGGIYRRFVKSQQDPAEYLVRLQAAVQRPVYLVPLLMFFTNKPPRSRMNLLDAIFGSSLRPGKLRRMAIMFKNPGRVFVETAEPLNIQAFLASEAGQKKSTADIAQALRNRVLRRLNRHRRSITGPVLKSGWERKERILTSRPLADFIAQHAENRQIPIEKVRKKAAAYVDEIAARYNPAFIDVAANAVGWIINLMFEGVSVNIEGLDRVKAASQHGPLVLIPCHKSHIDYLILSYVFHNHNMPCPHIAAGKNLSFWPMGPIFRAGGAFFIRRSFRGAVLYSRVFAAYMHSLLEEGFNIEFFIEGGRSRTGKLILPKLGLLSILINAYKNGACEDMIFAPIFVGYDRVLEESAYLRELEGGKKEPESMRQVIKARKVLKKRYGRIYIRFHQPVSLQSILAQSSKPFDQMSSKEQNALVRNIGYRVINAINNVTVVTAHALVAAAMLNMPRPHFSRSSLMEDLATYLRYLKARGASLADTLRMDPERAAQSVIDAYIQRKFIECAVDNAKPPPDDGAYRIVENKRALLEYYKNNCVALFIPAAFTALAILEKEAFNFASSDLHAGYTFLEEFFKNDFAYDVEKTPEQFVRKTLKAFIDDSILAPHPALPDTYSLSSAGLRKLRLLAGFLKTYFEAYWVALGAISRRKTKHASGGINIKKIQARGSQLYKRGEIQRPEALSKIYFENAASYFHAHGISSSNDAEKITYYNQKIQRYLQLLS